MAKPTQTQWKFHHVGKHSACQTTGYPCPTLALAGLHARPSAPQKPAGALRKQARGEGKKSCTQFQLQNLIVKPAGFEEQLDVYERRRDKKTQEKIGSSQEEETARSLFLTFTDAANDGECKRFYSGRWTGCLHRAGAALPGGTGVTAGAVYHARSASGAYRGTSARLLMPSSR